MNQASSLTPYESIWASAWQRKQWTAWYLLFMVRVIVTSRGHCKIHTWVLWNFIWKEGPIHLCEVWYVSSSTSWFFITIDNALQHQAYDNVSALNRKIHSNSFGRSFWTWKWTHNNLRKMLYLGFISFKTIKLIHFS